MQHGVITWRLCTVDDLWHCIACL